MTDQRGTMHHLGMWQVPYKVDHCLCEDGKRRVAWITGDADTYFSIPARVNIKGTSVTGFVTGHETDGEQDYEFIAYRYRKNWQLLNPQKEEHTSNA